MSVQRIYTHTASLGDSGAALWKMSAPDSFSWEHPSSHVGFPEKCPEGRVDWSRSWLSATEGRTGNLRQLWYWEQLALGEPLAVSPPRLLSCLEAGPAAVTEKRGEVDLGQK